MGGAERVWVRGRGGLGRATVIGGVHAEVVSWWDDGLLGWSRLKKRASIVVMGICIRIRIQYRQ